VVIPPPGTTALVFDWEGPYGHFRKPYSSASPVTYSLPPPTAVAGLLGAIAGWGKSEYWLRLGTDGWGVGVRLLRAVRRIRVGINLLKLAGGKDLRPRLGDPPRPTPMEFLVDPAYRIAFWHRDTGVMDALRGPLRSGTTVYTPSLGLACCLATVRWRGEWPIEPVRTDAEQTIAYVVSADAVSRIAVPPGSRQVRVRVPARMEGDRRVVRYEEVVLDEGAAPLRVSAKEVYRAGDEIMVFL
jgi:CRISPR-associated protein Cas5h